MGVRGMAAAARAACRAHRPWPGAKAPMPEASFFFAVSAAMPPAQQQHTGVY